MDLQPATPNAATSCRTSTTASTSASGSTSPAAPPGSSTLSTNASVAVPCWRTREAEPLPWNSDQISEAPGELLARAPVRPATEMSVRQVHQQLLAVRRDTAGRGHGGTGRSGAAGLDQRQGGRVSLHEHAHDGGRLLRPSAARGDESIGRQIGFRRLREMRLVGRGDLGDVGFEVNRKLKRGQQRSRRAAVICDRAKAIDHVHGQCPTATMRLAFGESRHGSTNPADSARRDGCHWHRVRRILQDIAGHAPHRVHLRRYDVYQSFPSTSPPAGVRAYVHPAAGGGIRSNTACTVPAGVSSPPSPQGTTCSDAYPQRHGLSGGLHATRSQPRSRPPQDRRLRRSPC